MIHLKETYDLQDRSVHDYYITPSSLWTWAAKELDIPHVVKKVQKPTFKDKAIIPFTQEEAKRILSDYWRKEPFFMSPSQAIRKAFRKDPLIAASTIVLFLISVSIAVIGFMVPDLTD